MQPWLLFCFFAVTFSANFAFPPSPHLIFSGFVFCFEDVPPIHNDMLTEINIRMANKAGLGPPPGTCTLMLRILLTGLTDWRSQPPLNNSYSGIKSFINIP